MPIVVVVALDTEVSVGGRATALAAEMVEMASVDIVEKI